MTTELYKFNINNIKPNIFNELAKHRMYEENGVLKRIYRNPLDYSLKECLLGLRRDQSNKPVSVCLISKHEFFGWEFSGTDLSDCYGIMAFYTSLEHRRKGLATNLFEIFDEEFKVRKICFSPRAKGIVKSLKDDEKTMLLYA